MNAPNPIRTFESDAAEIARLIAWVKDELVTAGPYTEQPLRTLLWELECAAENEALERDDNARAAVADFRVDLDREARP